MARFEKSFKDVEDKLATLLRRPFREVVAGMDELETAKMDVALAYVLNTLFYIYLRTRGSSVAKHPVREEIGRVKSYFLKMKKIKAEIEGEGGGGDKAKAAVDATAAATGAGPRLRLDRAAAERHVRGNLGGGGSGDDGGRGVKRSPSAAAANSSSPSGASGKKSRKKKSRKKKRRTK